SRNRNQALLSGFSSIRVAVPRRPEGSVNVSDVVRRKVCSSRIVLGASVSYWSICAWEAATWSPETTHVGPKAASTPSASEALRNTRCIADSHGQQGDHDGQGDENAARRILHGVRDRVLLYATPMGHQPHVTDPIQEQQADHPEELVFSRGCLHDAAVGVERQHQYREIP